MFMKSDLKKKLSKVEGFKDPKISLEQYTTPPDLASDVVFTAYMQGDLDGKVLDLGTGTGVLAIGAALLGADVTAADKDPNALDQAQKNAADAGVDEDINFVQSDVKDLSGSFDTVLMNPPFSQHSDQGEVFWKVATSISDKVYSVTPASGRQGIKSFINSTNHRVVEQSEFRIDLPATYGFHTEESRETMVDFVITEDKK